MEPVGDERNDDRDDLGRAGSAHGYPSFEAFYVEFASEVFAAALMLVRERGAAEDATQEAFFSISRQWAQTRSWPASRLRGQLFTIARRRCIDHLRRNGARERYLRRSGGFSSPVFDVEEEVMNRGAVGQAMALISELPPRQQDIAVLRFVVEVPEAEIGRLLHIPASTVRTNVQRIRERLRRRLAGFRPHPTAEETRDD